MANTITHDHIESSIAPQSRTWAVAAHLSSYVVFLGIPLPVIGPLVVWLLKRDQDAYAAWHAREALNFNISIMLYTFTAAVLVLALVGVVLVPAVLIAWFVLTIVGGVRAANDEYYRYPMTIRFVQ